MTSSWGRTPSFGAQTPMVGSMTPSYGSTTPMHGAGGRTPLTYGSQTPMHEGESIFMYSVVQSAMKVSLYTCACTCMAISEYPF